MQDGGNTPRAEPQTRGPAPAVAIILPFLVAVAVGLPAINGSMIRDDWDYVSGNPHVVCGAGLRDIFKSPFQPLESLGLYRPLTTLSLRLDAWLGGEQRPWIFHATNLLLAGAAASLLAVLARQLASRRFGPEAATRAALVAGLLFAVHPARTEAVCWISGRAENLMTFFSLACLVLATGAETLWRTVLAAVCAALAAWSKEQGFVLAVLVPLVAPPVTGKRLVQVVVVGGALGLAFIARWGALASLHLLPGQAVFENMTFPERVAQAFRLLFEYVRVTAWPHPLLFEYDTGALRSPGFGEGRVIAGIILFLGLAAAILCARTRPLLSAGAALFLLPLVPVLHVFLPIGEDFAERFLALPLAGAALLVGALAASRPAIGFGAGMLAVAVCGALFTVRAADYQSERAVYDALIERRPDSPAAKSLLASSLLLPDGGTKHANARDVARAETLLREAVTADPGLVAARITLATVMAQRRAPGRLPPLPADLEMLEDTATRFPSIPQTNGMLGIAAYERGAIDYARKALERELSVMPYDATAASYLAKIYEEQKDPKAAAAVMAGVRSRWEALWRRFPGFAPVAITYAHTLSDGSRDTDGAREVLRQAAAAACRPSDKRAIEAALADIGGR